ncbi:Hemolysin-type calcium-binding region [Clostridium cellulovorans 743B]|uniref:Hemolysin-type calcium-binding region n=1 Tax=Clostridium cellulovorans (strain ATCC 35296 / DSM 3052 / OCM 3 / 743B) TaxID=573061 RepID=D9SPU1_CLOC7|nr:Hemolysin-type calcium-binding region [Clostridium cellulovorans 743B]
MVLDINAIMKGYVYINGTNSNEQISGYCSGENEFIGNVIINGFDGNDTLNGSAGNDKVYGGNGDDTIVGNNGDDTLEGGAGKDTLRGSAGKDILKGGSEDDTLNGEIGDDILDGEKGTDTLTGGAGSDTYVFRKGDGQDIIVDYSGEANTIIDTLKFEDIDASEVSLNCTGYDLIIAVNGTTDSVRIQNYFTADLYKIENIQFKDGTTWDINTIRNSVVYANGTEEKDSLYAAGPVTMNGYGGDDTLRTENANDKIYGGAGIDTIIAGAGNDSLYGEVGNDILYGRVGDDLLEGGLGNDTLYGEAGQDIYVFRKGDGQDTINDTAGENNTIIDTLRFEDIDSTEVTLNKSAYDLVITVNGSSDSVRILSYFYSNDYKVEKIEFQDGVVLDINAIMKGYVYINGTNSNEQLNGYCSGENEFIGNVIINGFDGNDTLNGSAGNDKVYGGNGDDTIVGNNGDDTLEGGAGKDTLRGSAGKDILKGGSEDDTLNGEIGDDILDGEKGNDTLTGGAGSDTYVFRKGDGQDIIVDYSGEANTIIDTLKFEDIAASEVSLNCTGYDLIIAVNDSTDSVRIQNYFTADLYKIENIQFKDGTTWDINTIRNSIVYANGTEEKDSLYAAGPVTMNGYGGDDTLRTENANDKIYGGAGIDTIIAGAGNDSLYGEVGNDILYGRVGDDLLEGGLGNDTLYGEAGQDIYVFRKGDGQDTINDTAGENNTIIDTLRFEDIDSTEVTLNKSAYDLVITVNGSSDSVRILSYFYSNDYKVEKIEFQDGVVLDINAIMKGYVYINGTNSNEQISGYCSGENEFIGNVIINGFDGNDTLNGSAGNDKVYGGNGDDTIVGNNGDDTLEGGAGKDTLRGSAGKDILKGGSEDDTLNGEIGDDILDGEKGTDTLTGGAGSDTYVFRKRRRTRYHS